MCWYSWMFETLCESYEHEMRAQLTLTIKKCSDMSSYLWFLFEFANAGGLALQVASHALEKAALCIHLLGDSYPRNRGDYNSIQHRKRCAKASAAKHNTMNIVYVRKSYPDIKQ